MDNLDIEVSKKKKIILAILFIIIFVLIFGLLVFFMKDKVFFSTSTKKITKPKYINIDVNKKIENPTTEDLQNLIEQVQNENAF
jgi:membrane-bound ClpP family serine protease